MILVFYAVPGYSQNARITLKKQHATIKEALHEIENQTDYLFIYNNEVDVSKEVCVEAEHQPVSKVLHLLFKDNDIDFQVEKNHILLFARQHQPVKVSAAPLYKQEKREIKGRVLDIYGNPLVGANVLESGTNNSTITDYNGNFTFAVTPDAVLQISFLGFQTQLVQTKDDSFLQVILREDIKYLEELIVVGYSIQRKESLTGSLHAIPVEKLKNVTSPSVENMLSSKTPGVYVAPGSSQPGSVGAIIIRGKSTINGSTDPLWVVDGVIIGNSSGSLSPADIETMTILKDAASTAIYGSQGANGVIVVTTKSPKADRLRIDFSAKAGVSRLHSGNMKVMNGAELYDYYKSFTNQESIVFPRWNPDLRNSDFSWWDHASQTGILQEYNLSLTGGSEKLRSLVSLGVYDETGAVKGYHYTRYNLLYKTVYKPFEWLIIKPFISGSLRNVDNRQYSVSAMYSNLPWDSPYDKEGNIVEHYSPLWVNSNSTNYMYDLQWNFGKQVVYEFMGNFDFDIKITDWLTFISVNNIKLQLSNSKSYADPRSSSALGVKGRITEYYSEMMRRYTRQLLQFDKIFDKHAVHALLAYEFNDYMGKSVTATGIGFVPGFQILDVTAKPEATKGGISEWAVQSLFSNIAYAYDNKYLAQVSVRRDGASNFGDNAKYGNFFSVSGGWNIHREKFFDFQSVDELKLRVSYGSVGNRPSSLYPQYDLYSVSAAVSYNEDSGALISQIGNKDLTWEKSYTTGIGIDVGLFDRLRLTLDYYDKNTSDLLYQVPVSGLTGVTRVWRNIGAVRNKGFEAILSVDVLKQQDVLWTIEGNIGLNRNKVTELYGERDPVTGEVAPVIISGGVNIAGIADRILREGQDADTWYLREWAGVNPQTGAPQWYKTVKDPSGKEIREITESYAEANQVEIGAYTPRFFGGLSTSFMWKQFDANAVFGFSVGGLIYNYTRAEYDSDGAYSDRNQMRLLPSWKRWEKPGDIATHPVPSYNNSSNSNKVSSRYLENGSYFKMRTLSLGYNLQLPQYKLHNIRFFLTGENLFTISDYSGVDPELPSYDGRVVGVTTTVYPTTRKFLFGINVTF
ncbi:MAG: SusC/RagA family TonB-linked outer membrane protein [Bacteroidales bacterium]